MYCHSKYITCISATLILWIASFSQTKLYAQVNSIKPLYPAFNGNVLRDDEQQINPNQSPSPALTQNSNTRRSIPVKPEAQGQGSILRDDERQLNQAQLPWVLISNQPNQAVPSAVTNKISGFLIKEGLTPISCSTNPVVIISINNQYIACSSPTKKFPPGTYNTNIRDLDAAQR